MASGSSAFKSYNEMRSHYSNNSARRRRTTQVSYGFDELYSDIPF